MCACGTVVLTMSAALAIRLWHQLTDKVQAFVLDDGNFRARNMLDVRLLPFTELFHALTAVMLVHVATAGGKVPVQVREQNRAAAPCSYRCRHLTPAVPVNATHRHTTRSGVRVFAELCGEACACWNRGVRPACPSGPTPSRSCLTAACVPGSSCC